MAASKSVTVYWRGK